MKDKKVADKVEYQAVDRVYAFGKRSLDSTPVFERGYNPEPMQKTCVIKNFFKVALHSD